MRTIEIYFEESVQMFSIEFKCDHFPVGQIWLPQFKDGLHIDQDFINQAFIYDSLQTNKDGRHRQFLWDSFYGKPNAQLKGGEIH